MRALNATLMVASTLLMVACSPSRVLLAPENTKASAFPVLAAQQDFRTRMENDASGTGVIFDANAMTLRTPPPVVPVAARSNRFTCVQEEPALDIDAVSGIELNYADADIREVLQEISMMTGFSIVMDESVEGTVNVLLSNARLADTLEVVLAAGGYAYKVMPHHILVGPADPRSRSFGQLASTCIFKPENAQPDQLVSALSPVYQPFVTMQAGSRHLTVTAPMSVQRRIQPALMALDQAPRQVLLEMSIVEVSSRAMEILGVGWGKTVRDTQVPGGLRQLGVAEWRGNVLAGTPLSSVYQGAGISASRTLAESVQFLKSSGSAQVRAMPSIVTQDGKQANFLSQSTVWLPYENVSGSGSGGGDRRKELTYGINMTMIPRISTTDGIKLEIKEASVSDLVYDDRGTPQVVSHQISNTVDIHDGDTLVLGGLLQHKQRQDNTGLPGVRRLRLLGGLFGQDRGRTEETEVLILIRPTIIGG